jgi:hypothetical protein
MAATPLDNYFAQDASRIEGEVYRIQRVKGRVSALIKKQELPDGIGYNYSTVVTKRSGATGGSGWIDVAEENGTVNNCVPTPSTVAPAQTVLNYSAVQRSIFSTDICFRDARRGYDFETQVGNIRSNFVEEIVDVWEDRDKLAFFTNAGHKLVFNNALTENTNSAVMPANQPTKQINQYLLDDLYQQIIQDGGGMEPYAMRNGSALLPLICSQEAHRTIIKGDASVREDFRFADMGEGENATLLKSWNVDQSYGGYMHMIDNKMPRYDFVNGAWVERPFYSSSATTIGNELVVNPAYKTAAYEDCYIWNPNVVIRQVPKPRSSVGADTRGNAVNFNGEVMWRNIPDKVENPYEDIGFWAAALYAAYKPAKIQYGYVVRFLRCPGIQGSACPSY